MPHHGRVKWVFLAPAALWVLLFTLAPFLCGIWMSLQRFNPNPTLPNEFIGLGNYTRFLQDPAALHSLKITLIFVLTAVPIQMTLGLLLALLFSRGFPWRKTLRAVLTLPLFATPIAVGYLFVTVFNEKQGLINGFLNLDVPWLSDAQWAMASILIVDIWQWTPFCFLILLAALQGVPEDYYEAAALETANPFHVFRHVTLPVLQPTLILVLLLRLTEAFKVFDIPYTLTNGGPATGDTEVLSMYAYFRAFRFRDYGYGAAISFVLFAMVMVIVAMLFKRIRQVYQ